MFRANTPNSRAVECRARDEREREREDTPPMGGVVPVLYRHVARLARLHDRDPALKALLLLVPTKEYDWRERRCRLCVEEQRRCLGVEVSPTSSGRPPAAASPGQLA